MSDLMVHEPLPRTEALRRALGSTPNQPVLDDFLFLEAWEIQPSAQLGTTFRAHQIRRANPRLAAEIRAEVLRGRPLTASERAALAPPPPRRGRTGKSN